MMEEAPSWKGHGFTLAVFAGIVVLCVIFFVLGMLVGRSHGQRAAENASALPAAGSSTLQNPEPSAVAPLVENADTRQASSLPPTRVAPAASPASSSSASSASPAPDPPPARIEPPAPPPATSAPAAAASTPARPSAASMAGVINVQVAALSQRAAAEQLLEELRGKGFIGFILAPVPGDAPALYRVQVGPYTDSTAAELAKVELESLGYPGIIRR